jgi:hypothetical protein
LWDAYLAALTVYQESETEETTSALIAAYESWCWAFDPAHARTLVAQLRRNLAARRSA